MLCQYCLANYTSCQNLHEMRTLNVSQSNCRKSGLITNNTFGAIVILLIGPLIEIASLILIRAERMLYV